MRVTDRARSQTKCLETYFSFQEKRRKKKKSNIIVNAENERFVRSQCRTRDSSVPAVRASTATLHHNLGNVRDAESKQVSQISFH